MEIEEEHSTEQVQEEVDICLGLSKAVVTLGTIMLLAKHNSPLVYGGTFTEEDLRTARKIFGKNADLNAVKSQIEASSRAFDIIQPYKGGSTVESSKYAPFSPEWMVDRILPVCKAIPTATIDYILWRMPYALLAHICAGEHRANCGITKRPDKQESIKEALEVLNNGNN